MHNIPEFRDIPKSTFSPLTPGSKGRHPALCSAKLAALHARLSLPARFSLPMLARCLTHPTANTEPNQNNSSLAILGQELLAYYTSEWLICNYPRLPMPVIFAAQYAYVGDKTLSLMRQEWGVEAADSPEEGVDIGYLRFNRIKAGNALADDEIHQIKQLSSSSSSTSSPSSRPRPQFNDRRGISSRIVYDDEFGNINSGITQVHSSTIDALSSTVKGTSSSTPASFSDGLGGISLETASASFIRAVFGALYLSSGLSTFESFHTSHILSRQLPLDKLFFFRQPTRDLARLCARENLESPVARLLSETGRRTRTPVFVVGVYSGGEKLGEDAGSSLDEARTRAAAHALRSWYLYSPPREQVNLPSKTEEYEKNGKRWIPQMIDIGEVIT